MKLCSVEECERKSQARGWCNTHYSRWRVRGDPLVSRFRPRSFEEAYNHYVKEQGECLVWDGVLNGDGYAHTKTLGKTQGAHRAVWIVHNGDIPVGLKVDHKCHVRNCVLLAHLRLVTHKENMENLVGDRKNNTSGYQGVNFSKSCGKWIARTQHNNKRLYLGRFDTAEQAHEAALAARMALHTHNDKDRE